MKQISLVKDRNLNQKIIVFCHACKRETNQSILASIQRSGQEPMGPDISFYWDEEFQIVRCDGCEAITFRSTYSNSEQLDDQGDAVEEHLYPNPVESKHREPISESWPILPNKLDSIYEETIQALNLSQHILAGIGIRAILETICKDQDAQGKDLEKKIDDLKERRLLTAEGAGILHDLRILGNRAAHEVKPHSEAQLNLAMDIVEHLLQEVYILPFRAKKAFKDTDASA